ncbi:MAG: hypothetical protein ACYC96_06390 [Fimbriimonadaceae bacterium]
MIKAVVLLSTGLGLAGCGHKTSVVGTWTANLDGSTAYLTSDRDGRFHAEEFDPAGVLASAANGTYNLDGNHLTQEARSPDAPLLFAGPQIVNSSGDTLTIRSANSRAERTLTFHRANRYHYVDRSGDLVGTWKSKDGAVREYRADGTFTFKERLMPDQAALGRAALTSTHAGTGGRWTFQKTATPGSNGAGPVPATGHGSYTYNAPTFRGLLIWDAPAWLANQRPNTRHDREVFERKIASNNRDRAHEFNFIENIEIVGVGTSLGLRFGNSPDVKYLRSK